MGWGITIIPLMTWERTFILVKPDGVKRGLIGEVLKRYERAGLQIVAAKLVSCHQEQAEKHYEEHKGKKLFSLSNRSLDLRSPLWLSLWKALMPLKL